MKKLIVLMMALFFILAGCGTSTNNEKANSSNNGQGNSGQAEQPEQETPEDVGEFQQFTNTSETIRTVEIETTKGKIVVNLYPDAAPKAVENFITHAENGYYDGLIFHRVIQDFMIQGGDPKGDGTGGESIWGEPFEDEFDRNMLHFKGALSMANSGPNTNGSQFFIVHASEVSEDILDSMIEAKYPTEVIDLYKEHGGTPHLDFRHTVFGQVVEGMDIVDEIAQVKKGSADKPVEDVVIEKMTVVK
ncbi:Putative peptidyl-prolyl cis-trans isomerase [Bacillus sp. THAF10]|uniref:peptidylprolyl isomerase n=1 Tax=Bacillus sp. THAF10 TaxID=2587848 RepID=UPI0012679567|nr:peptidylprolyl isomerase [Bacillus sp. THAF10]QFT90394.1 Putative peptidyl-prolyl cis-trans isomerase [Bacillus sp. THAF10]